MTRIYIEEDTGEKEIEVSKSKDSKVFITIRGRPGKLNIYAQIEIDAKAIYAALGAFL